jgi:hypothetical protein
VGHLLPACSIVVACVESIARGEASTRHNDWSFERAQIMSCLRLVVILAEAVSYGTVTF